MAAALDRVGLKWWLGRGVLRHHLLHGRFGDLQGDIDFHVLREDEQAVRRFVEGLAETGWRVVSGPAQSHKITMRRGDIEIEFVFLNRDGDVLWHQAGWPEKRRFDCPERVFGERRAQMFGVDVRVPYEEYLPAVFGPDWRDGIKGSGGIAMA